MISDRKKTLLLVVLLILTPVFVTGALLGNFGSSSVPAVAGYNDAAVSTTPGRTHHASNQLALRADGGR